MQCQRRLQSFLVNNIGNVFEQSGVAFRLVPPYDVLLVSLIASNDRYFTLQRFNIYWSFSCIIVAKHPIADVERSPFRIDGLNEYPRPK